MTLIDVLVCMIVVAIIAALALPSLLAQRAKAQDRKATTAVATATTAIITFLTDEDTYDARPADVEQIEPALRQARNLAVSGTADTYEISVDSDTGTTFTLKRDAGHGVTRDCSAPDSGLCRLNPDADGDRW